MNEDEPGASALKDLLDGPVGPTAHLAPTARRIARRRTARRRTGLTGAAAVVAIAAFAAPALLAPTDALAPEFAGPDSIAVEAAETVRALGMDAAFGQEHGQIAADCVRAAGIDYSPRWAQAPGAPFASSPWLLPTGAGYGFSDRTANTGGRTPAGWEAAMYGTPRMEVTISIENGGSVTVPVGGCHGQATEALYGVPAEDYERTYQQVRALPDEAVRAAVQDGPVRDAAGRWSECLADQGWEAGTPDDLDNALASELAAADSDAAAREELVRREAALLEADTRCREQSGLQAAFDQAFVEHGTRLAAANQVALAPYRRMLDHATAVFDERRRP